MVVTYFMGDPEDYMIHVYVLSKALGLRGQGSSHVVGVCGVAVLHGHHIPEQWAPAGHLYSHYP